VYSQKAILNFYEWEIKGRGCSLFPYQVNLEPTFTKFYHKYDSDIEYFDDGKVPTLFEKLFSSQKKLEPIEQIEEDPPDECDYNIFLRQIKITFSKLQEFDKEITLEFLAMLSESKGQISFEIIGKHKSIEIQIICNIYDCRRFINLLHAYFPDLIISETETFKLPFDSENNILIVDFGYSEEFMRPINSSFDSLTSIISVLDNLEKNETAGLCRLCLSAAYHEIFKS